GHRARGPYRSARLHRLLPPLKCLLRKSRKVQVAASGDFYLCPLSENQLSRAKRRALLQPVWEGTQALQPVWRPGPEGQPDELGAEGFAVDVALTATVAAREVRWTERRWLVRSQAYAQAQETALERRLAKAEAALRDLPTRKQGKKQRFHA